VEEETPGGTGRLVLRVHPAIGQVDERAIRAALLQEMGRHGLFDAFQARLIQRAGSIAIERMPPLATSAGKVLPFQIDRSRRVER